MTTVCWRFLCDESGATAIEYGLIVAGIAIAILGAIGTLSDSVKTMLFDKISNALTA
jgi:pilus assembly protein Flp/PilA